MRFNGTVQGDYTSEARKIAQRPFLASAETDEPGRSRGCTAQAAPAIRRRRRKHADSVKYAGIHLPESPAQAEPVPQGAIFRGPLLVSCVRKRIKRSRSDSDAWVQSVGRVEEGARPPVYLFLGRPGLLDAIKKPPVILAQVQNERKHGFNRQDEPCPGWFFPGISPLGAKFGVFSPLENLPRPNHGRTGRFNCPGRHVCVSSVGEIAPAPNSA